MINEFLGNEYKDRLSNFVGLAIQVVYHIDGTIQVALSEPPYEVLGWFDVSRLEKTDSEAKTSASIGYKAPPGIYLG